MKKFLTGKASLAFTLVALIATQFPVFTIETSTGLVVICLFLLLLAAAFTLVVAQGVTDGTSDRHLKYFGILAIAIIGVHNALVAGVTNDFYHLAGEEVQEFTGVMMAFFITIMILIYAFFRLLLNKGVKDALAFVLMAGGLAALPFIAQMVAYQGHYHALLEGVISVFVILAFMMPVSSDKKSTGEEVLLLLLTNAVGHFLMLVHYKTALFYLLFGWAV